MSAHPSLKFELCHPHAVLPSRAHPTDTGYDLTIIEVAKTINPVVTLYDTGIKACIDPGYYLEIVPRSSIIKTGYMLANNVGIIDEDYRGNLFVALAKIYPDAPRLQLPFKGFQLIPRKRIDCDVECVDAVDSNTVRGQGGFGSSDKK